MPIDWSAFDADIDKAIENAGKRTDQKLASRISSVTRLTDEEIMKLFPAPADVEKLKNLMLIVNSAEEKNRKTAKLISNIQELAGTVITLLGKFV